ncbi:MAG: acyl carrier protein [Flavobacteriales bacterium]|jgi:acyl carrier protein|nr:acyl carrier protein [Flavobacteriales bacterium]
MDRTELAQQLRERLIHRAERLGLRAEEVGGSLDLVRSGLLDSLGFVDLITELEQVVGREVDLATAFDAPGATTFDGVLELFLRS